MTEEKKEEYSGPFLNTDREIYRRPSPEAMDPDGYYQPSLHITESGALSISVGGTVHTRSIEEWHDLAGGVFPGIKRI